MVKAASLRSSDKSRFCSSLTLLGEIMTDKNARKLAPIHPGTILREDLEDVGALQPVNSSHSARAMAGGESPIPVLFAQSTIVEE